MNNSVFKSTFSYRVRHSRDIKADTLFTIVPLCNTTKSEADPDVCYPGCHCNPFILYVNVCTLGQCTVIDKHPSNIPGSYKYMLIADTTDKHPTEGKSSYTLAIPLGDSQCNPTTSSQDCMYYITALSKYEKKTNLPVLSLIPSFTITATTQTDTALVPCASKSIPADGMIYTTSSTSSINNIYEICASTEDEDKTDEVMILSLEICSNLKNTKMYVCSDHSHCNYVIPSSTDYAYYSDYLQSCALIWGKKKDGTPGWTDRDCVPSLGRPFISLEQLAHSNYFTFINTTKISNYRFNIEVTQDGGSQAPVLLPAKQTSRINVIPSSRDMSSPSLYIQWNPLLIRFFQPETSILTSTDIVYTLYIIDIAKITPYLSENILVLSTPCGLEYAVTHYPKLITKVMLPKTYKISGSYDNPSPISTTISSSSLSGSKYYNFTLLGQCDSECLISLGQQSHVTSDYACNKNQPCITRQFLYQTQTIYLNQPHTIPTSGLTTLSVFLYTIGIITSVITILLICMWGYYWKLSRHYNNNRNAYGMDNYSSRYHVQLSTFSLNKPLSETPLRWILPSSLFRNTNTNPNRSTSHTNNEEEDDEDNTKAGRRYGSYVPPSSSSLLVSTDESRRPLVHPSSYSYIPNDGSYSSNNNSSHHDDDNEIGLPPSYSSSSSSEYDIMSKSVGKAVTTIGTIANKITDKMMNITRPDDTRSSLYSPLALTLDEEAMSSSQYHHTTDDDNNNNDNEESEIKLS